MSLIERIVERVARVQALSPRPHFGAFDCDGSIILDDIEEAFIAYLPRHKFPEAEENFKEYYRLIASRDTKGAYRFGAQLLQGISVHAVQSLVENIVIEEGEGIGEVELLGHTIAKGITLRESVVDLIARVRGLKIEPWVVSASQELLVHSLMKHYGLNMKVVGVRNVIRCGVITSELIEPLPIYEDKVACIREQIHPSARPLIAVGDSVNDYAMLKHAIVPVVVDRGNELAKIARKEGWFIL